MKEFEQSSDAWNRQWKSSSQVLCLKSRMEEFEPSSRQVLCLESEMEEFGPSSVARNRERNSSRQVRCLESEMEVFEPGSMLGIRNGGVRLKL